MGFGILLVGYFLLINITYFEYTDLLGALFMLLGLYKLSFVNKDFKYSLIPCILFAVFGLGELAISLISFFVTIPSYDVLLAYLGFARYAIIFALSVFIQRAIVSLCEQIDYSSLRAYFGKCLSFSFVYLIGGLFDIPLVASGLGAAAGYVFFAVIIAIIIYHAAVLIGIYKSFVGICMSGDEKKEKSPGFLDKLWGKIEDGNREYAQYRQEKKNKKKGKK